MSPYSEPLQDVARDALALLRAAVAHDYEALKIVAIHLADPPLTATQLAIWFAEAAANAGVDLPAGCARYQRDEL